MNLTGALRGASEDHPWLRVIGQHGTQLAPAGVMLIFSDAERAYLEGEIRTDRQGRQILVGLTFEETAEFWNMVRTRASGGQLSRDEDQRYWILRDKLDIAVCAGRR